MSHSPGSQPSLIRGLGPIASASIVVGAVIGTGVFLKMRVMMCNVESPWLAIGAWLAAGLLTLAGALTYAELTAMMPAAGGEYVIIREAYGRLAAFLYGWTQFAVAYTGAQAAKAVGFAIFLNAATGGAGSVPAIAIAIAVITTLVNCLAVTMGGRISVFLTALKILLLLAIGAGAFVLAQRGWEHLSLSGAGGLCEGVSASARAGTAGWLRGFGAAMLGALWAYDGWTNVAHLAGEVRDPKRNLPLALIGGIVVVILLYLFANLGYLNVLTPHEIANVPGSSSVAAEVARKYLGPAAVAAIAVAMMISTLGSLNTGTMAGARITYAMAKDGLFFRPFAKVSQSTRVPIGALFFQCVWTCVLALSGSYDRLTDYSVFASWIFYGMSAASIFLFRARRPAAERPYRALGYPVVPALFLVVTAWLLYNTILATPVESGIGLGLMALGLPVYAYFAYQMRSSSTRAPTLSDSVRPPANT